MRNLKTILAVLAVAGLVLAVGAAVWTLVARPLPGGLRPWLIGGVVPAVAFLGLFWDDVVRAVGRRQLRYGTNTFVLVVAMLGILALVNYVASRNTKRFDLTKGQRYSLSDQTRKVLAGLQDEVRITYFERQREMARGQDRLEEYQAL